MWNVKRRANPESLARQGRLGRGAWAAPSKGPRGFPRPLGLCALRRAPEPGLDPTCCEAGPHTKAPPPNGPPSPTWTLGFCGTGVPVKAHSLHGILCRPLLTRRPCPSSGLVTDPKRRKDRIGATRPSDTASRPMIMPGQKVYPPAALRAPVRTHACTHTPSCPRRSASPWTRSGGQAVAFSLLQRIFPTRESNRGLLRCRRILSQKSYQGKPERRQAKFKARPKERPG